MVSDRASQRRAGVSNPFETLAFRPSTRAKTPPPEPKRFHCSSAKSGVVLASYVHPPWPSSALNEHWVLPHLARSENASEVDACLKSFLPALPAASKADTIRPSKRMPPLGLCFIPIPSSGAQ